MTNDNPAFVEQEKAELEKIVEEATSTISPEEDARIRAEVCEIMQKKFAVGRAKLKSNLIAQNETFVKSGVATFDTDVLNISPSPLPPFRNCSPR